MVVFSSEERYGGRAEDKEARWFAAGETEPERKAAAAVEGSRSAAAMERSSSAAAMEVSSSATAIRQSGLGSRTVDEARPEGPVQQHNTVDVTGKARMIMGDCSWKEEDDREGPGAVRSGAVQSEAGARRNLWGVDGWLMCEGEADHKGGDGCASGMIKEWWYVRVIGDGRQREMKVVRAVAGMQMWRGVAGVRDGSRVGGDTDVEACNLVFACGWMGEDLVWFLMGERRCGRGCDGGAKVVVHGGRSPFVRVDGLPLNQSNSYQISKAWGGGCDLWINSNLLSLPSTILDPLYHHKNQLQPTKIA